MKRLFVFAVALGFLACVPASAQNNDHRGGKHDAAASNAGRGSANTNQNNQGRTMMRQNNRAMTGGAHMNAGGTGQAASYGRAAGTARSMHNNAAASATTGGRFLPTSGDVRSVQTGRSMADRTRNNSGWSGNTQPRATTHSTADRSRSNSGWANNTATRQPSINSLRLNVQSSHRFHNGDYRVPAGYQTRHWGYGERLPRGYFASDYWIGDFLMFGLFAPPTDLVWVRVGDDALLVDRYSGDIVQVRYDVFY